MDNDALMRRISAATDAKKQATAGPHRAPPPPIHRSEAPEPGPSHMHAMLRGAHPQPQTPAQPVAQQAPAQAAAPIAQAAAPVAQPQAYSPPPRAPGVTAPQMSPPLQPQQPAAAPLRPAPAPPHPSTAPQAMQAPQAAHAPVQPQQQTHVQAPIPVQAPATAPAPPPLPDGMLMSFRQELVQPAAGEQAEVRPMRKEERAEAFVVACDGNMALVQGDTTCVDTITGLTWAVGRMLSIVVGEARVVGMICDIKMPDDRYAIDKKSLLHFKLELQGEVREDSQGNSSFVKGITSYPGVGSVVHQIRAADLESIYAATGSTNGVIGHLSQDESIPAFVDVPDMLAKHFAVLGSTGCGKSASVSLLLHCCQELVPDLRTIILDPHNEYSKAFPNANTIEQSQLDMPFWMFQLEEYVEVLFRGKPIVHEEVDALREFIPDAKARFRDGEDRVKLRPASSASALTADTSAPYRMADLVALIEDEMGLLESRYDKSILKSLKARITAHTNDARYAFMFRHKTIEDIAQNVISNFFCLPGNGSFSTIIQMAGMPAEIVNAVASVLCRLSFELAIAAKGNLKILVVCEEAHRYVPAGKGGFEPTRRAIARIAKEGRKYGTFMAIISQRPSELDPTILSQCSTVFSLRLTNDFDQDIIRRAISSSSASTIAFISSLANRECIAFGEGMSTPMRMKFRNLPKAWLPGAEADVFGNSNPVVDAQQSNAVYHQWRSGGH